MKKNKILPNENVNKAIRVSTITLIINLILSLLKFAAGYIGKSSAMLSDAVHSASDVLSTIIVMVGIKISEKRPDREHPYGAAKHTNSDALMADAWHHRSDALSSVGSLMGILGARLGFAILDPIASVVICSCILKAALDIFRESINKMVDHSCDNTTETRIRELVLQQQGVEGIDDLKTRMFGAKMYVDIEVLADGSLVLYDAHRIAEEVHQAIEHSFPQCKHCMVHVNTNELSHSA